MNIDLQSPHAVRLGLIGAGIQGSRSPYLHETEARALGLDCSYRLIDLEQLPIPLVSLPELLDAVQSHGYAGVNITHPCKQAVIPLLDELSPEADAIGAVNTLVFREGRRIGYNTDWLGFAESVRRGLSGVSLDRVVLLGAGGAGAAVGYAALHLGVERLSIYDVTLSRAVVLSERLGALFGPDRVCAINDLTAEMASANGLIQATPIGMLGHAGLPLPIELLRPAHWIADIIYFPSETELLRQARAIGCRAINGLGMVVFQGAEAFRLFTGVTPDVERMLQSLA